MGNTVTINQPEASVTRWGFDPETKRAVILKEETGRTQDHTIASLAKLTEISQKEGAVKDSALEHAAHYEEVGKSLAASQAPAPQNTPGAPGFVMKQSFT